MHPKYQELNKFIYHSQDKYNFVFQIKIRLHQTGFNRAQIKANNFYQVEWRNWSFWFLQCWKFLQFGAPTLQIEFLSIALVMAEHAINLEKLLRELGDLWVLYKPNSTNMAQWGAE